MLREHIRVDVLDASGLAGTPIAAAVGDVLVTWFLVVFGIGCWLMAQATWETETATMDWFRMGYVYVGVGVAVAAMIWLIAADLDPAARWASLRGRRGRRHDPDDLRRRSSSCSSSSAFRRPSRSA